ncbi:hypothetical protein [Aggregatibacter kilianii]|uniref:hypothetical protein n=1 Tax=Aggregatibacter kilianii TaxID=2025884 RepID=UPI000D65116C|nr:hypothetical protein [Aggregatibacter kilianii]
MPLLLGLSFLIAIYFAIHAVRTGQDRYWLFIMFSFPFLGSAVYFFAIFLPSFRSGYSGQILESKLRRALDPGRELREAEQNFEQSETVANRLALAKALVDNNRVAEALPHYQTVLQMDLYKTMPDILLAYAYALYLADDAASAKQQLDYLRVENPDYQSNEGHLLYAKILTKLDDRVGAMREFNALVAYYPTLEAHISYVEILLQWNEKEKAKQLLDVAELHIKRQPPHVKRLNAEWIKRAKQLRNALQ